MFLCLEHIFSLEIIILNYNLRKICGSLEYYDKTYDRISTKVNTSVNKLKRTNRAFHNVTTLDDPVIRAVSFLSFASALSSASLSCASQISLKLTKTDGNVFAIDSIIATLMCCSRSVYPWDIIATVFISF